MLALIKDIYHKYADSSVMQFVSDIYRNGFPIVNFIAFLRVRKMAKKKNMDRKIKVVFICQYPQAWNKQRLIYEKMRCDDRFDAFIISVPDDINNVTNEVNEYYCELYGDCVINAVQKTGWYDLKLINPDYVFFQRPYDQYLPKEYRSDTLAKYTKVCYVNYGYELSTASMKICLSKKFFRNVYYFFAENYLIQTFNAERFKYAHKKKYRKSVDLGYPALEDFMQGEEKYKSRDNYETVVLWTPRWTEEKRLGGSNFMKYKDKVVNYFRKKEECSLVFRPHPMTFAHMVSTGKMTQKDVENYLEQFDSNQNMKYDQTKDYTEVFWTSDILLTDFSSIVVEYFITGKPIVYCNTECNPDEFFEQVLSVLYIVNDWNEVENTLNMLLDGYDPLKQKRKEKIKELFNGGFNNISDRFLEEIYSDFVS